MNIAFDLDGVLYDWHSAVYTYCKAFKNIVVSELEFWSDFDKYMDKEFLDYIVTIPMLYSCMFPDKRDLEFLNRLSENNSIYYITSRPESEKLTTELYLNRYKFPQATNLFLTKEKDTLAKLLEIDIFVEDEPKHISKLKEVCNIILIRKPWNIELQDTVPSIFYVYELEDLLNEI